MGQQWSIDQVVRGMAEVVKAGRTQDPHRRCPEILQQQSGGPTGGVVGQHGLHLKEDNVEIRVPLEEVVGDAHAGDAPADDHHLRCSTVCH